MERNSRRTGGGDGWRDCLAGNRLGCFILVCCGVWLTAVDSLVTATIMPGIGEELGGYAYFGWAVAGFMLGAVVACASAGRLTEIIGLRRAAVLAGLIFAGGCILDALAPSMETFLAGRLLQGVGGGWISGFAMVAVGLYFPARHLARVFAATAAIWGIATLVGPLIGGMFAAVGNWRGVFCLFALQALAFAAGAAWLLGRERRPAADSGIPWPQLGMLTVAIGAVGLANVSASPLRAALMVMAGLALLGLLMRLDAGARIRLFPRQAGDLRTVCGAGYAGMFALTAASMGLHAYGPAILQELRGLTALWAGYAVAAMALAWTIAAFAVSGASAAREPRWIRLGAIAVLLGTVLLALVMRAAALGWVVGGAAVMGTGFGLSSSLMNRRVLRELPEEDRAIGSSALIAVRQAGGAVGAAIAGVAANLSGFDAGLTPASAKAAAVWVFVAAIPLGLGGALALWWMTRGESGE